MMISKLKVQNRDGSRYAARRMTGPAPLARAGATIRSSLELVPSTLFLDLL